MKKSNFFFALIVVFAMMIIVSTNVRSMNEPPPCPLPDCLPDPGFVPITYQTTACTFDGSTNTYCCVDVTYTLTRYQACPPSLFPYWRFNITSIKAVGDCYKDQDKMMDAAVKAVIAASAGHNIGEGSISVPACIIAQNCDDPTMTTVFESCGTGCCRFDFKAGWDSVANDVSLVDSRLTGGAPCTVIPGCITCRDNCADTLFPENGLFDLFGKLPSACTSGCNTSQSIMPMLVEHNAGGNRVTGEFSIGFNGGIPCINLHYFWIHSGPLTPETALELLIKKALFDYASKPGVTLPFNIKVNVWKCLTQLYSALPIYIGCTNGCCTIEFQITGTLPNITATEVNRNPSPELCTINCTDICDILNSGPYSLPKLSVNESKDNEKIKVNIIPNPTTGLFYLNFDAINSGSHKIKIVDMTGMEVFFTEISAKSGNNNFKIDLSHIANGVYYLQIIENGLQISSIKFIKN